MDETIAFLRIADSELQAEQHDAKSNGPRLLCIIRVNRDDRYSSYA